MKRLKRGEEGLMALGMALAISAVLSASVGIVFQVASMNTNDAAFRRQTSQSLYAAEGGLDLAYAELGQSSATNLPCGSGSLSKSFSTVPVGSSFSVSVTYYDTFPVTDSALSCSSVQNGSVVPQAAEIVSQGTAHSASQYMEALVKLTPSTTGSVFDQALFSNATMTGSNNPTVFGHNGNDGNIYTNGSINCGNNFVDQGSVVAQGAFTGTNNCTVDANITSVGNITLSNNATIGGNATSTGSTGCASVGNITMSNNAKVTQSAYAYCTISLSNNAVVVQSKVQHDTTLSNPTVENFPVVPEPTGTNDSGAQAAWQAAGYTVVTNNTCSGAGSVYNTIPAYTAPTVVMTTCALSWTNNSSISLQTNVAVFSTGGFSMSNNTSWQSNNSTTRLLYLMVPYSVSGTNTTCTNGNPGITLQNNTSFANTLDVLFYTPCQIKISNNSTGYGQIYGGVVNVSNNFTSHFVPLPTVPGSSGGGTLTGPLSVAIVYERQVSSPTG